jgi:hypothetical protein
MRLTSLMILLVAACGGSGSDDRVDEFIGTWTYNAGSTFTLDCQNDALDTTDTATGTFAFQTGTASDLILAPEPDDTCAPVRLDVSGDTATVQSGQSCMDTDTQNNITTTTNIGVGSYKLNADGMMLTGMLNGNVTITGSFSTTCTFTSSLSGTKSGT